MSDRQPSEDLRVQNQIGQPHRDANIPDLRTLRHRFLDERRHNTPGPLLDCVAHMLLYIDQPDALLEIGLSYLVRTLGVCRGDAGISAPYLTLYTPTAVYLDPRREAPTMLGISIPNKHPLLQLIWHTTGPVRFEQVEQNPVIGDLREAFINVWQLGELALIDDFCQDFLAPILAYSLRLSKRLPQVRNANALTSAELEAVRLATEGLTYGEIAARLNKSVRTVDNQLRRAREKLAACRRERTSSHASRSGSACVARGVGKSAKTKCGRRQNRVRESGPIGWKGAPVPALGPT